jgi:hypothetical protein
MRRVQTPLSLRRIVLLEKPLLKQNVFVRKPVLKNSGLATLRNKLDIGLWKKQDVQAFLLRNVRVLLTSMMRKPGALLRMLDVVSKVVTELKWVQTLLYVALRPVVRVYLSPEQGSALWKS